MTTYPRIERDHATDFQCDFGTLIHDHYRAVYADDNICQILGVDSVDDLLTLPSLLPLFLDLDPLIAQQRYDAILSGQLAPTIHIYRMTKPSGDTAYILAAESLLHCPENPLVQLSIIDITDKYNQYNQLEKSAYIDALSGLTNRNGFDIILHQQSANAKREHTPLSCLFIDIDNFKRINDTYGHHIGDKVIRLFADCCKHSIRKTDFIGRWGGEEFLILLPDTSEHFARILAERLRWRVSKLRLMAPDTSIPFTISIGIRTQYQNNTSPSQLVEDADSALSYAKRTGKNQVMTHSDITPIQEDAFSLSFMREKQTAPWRE
ncbi:GGDEF domain-containing protein [Photobacterium japonica]|uniref:GGDEF domain-containing protein n=1 Tax=Photobacterium japonica TaxID=2910235 RepID=UPI003D12EEA2